MTKSNDVEEKLDDGGVKVRLHKPIRALDKTLAEITFRKPSARDIRTCGDPVFFEQGSKGNVVTRIDEEKMSAMMAQLADIPLGSIDAMDAVDWKNCQWALAPFFIPRDPPSST